MADTQCARLREFQAADAFGACPTGLAMSLERLRSGRDIRDIRTVGGSWYNKSRGEPLSAGDKASVRILAAKFRRRAHQRDQLKGPNAWSARLIRDRNEPPDMMARHRTSPTIPTPSSAPPATARRATSRPGGTLSYTVDFENDGSAAAQDVTVTEQLDSNLDWSTFQLGSFGFGPINVTVPAGLTQYQTTVSYQNSDGSSLNVRSPWTSTSRPAS